MIDLNDAVSLLQAKRKELVGQLDAVDKALAALSGVEGAVTMAPEENLPQATERESAPNTILPIKLKPRRTLSDDHRHALNEGRRKARHSKDAAAGFAREMPDDSSRLAGASAAHGRQPRLVKRGQKTSRFRQ